MELSYGRFRHRLPAGVKYMELSKFFRADFGSDLIVHDKYNFKERLTGYLTLARPMFLILTPLNAASAAILSIRGLPSWQLCLAGFFTGALAAAGVNIFNRYADRQRDKTLWPQRGIPSGRAQGEEGLDNIYSVLRRCPGTMLDLF